MRFITSADGAHTEAIEILRDASEWNSAKLWTY